MYIRKTFFLLIILAMPIWGQQKQIGKIISTQEADKLFGPATIEKEIPVGIIQESINQSTSFVLFNIVSDQLFVSSDNENFVYPKVSYSPAPNAYFKFSNSIVQEFIKQSPDASTIKVQMRTNVLCLTNGKVVLEFSLICPPYCLGD
jgi:hypothetical protein